MSALNYSDEDGHHSDQNEDISGTLGETEDTEFKNKIPGLTSDIGVRNK